MKKIIVNNIFPLSGSTITINAKTEIKSGLTVGSVNNISLDAVNNIISTDADVYKYPLNIQHKQHEGKSIFIKNVNAADNIIKFSNASQDWYFAIDNSDSNKLKISADPNFSNAGIELSNTGMLKLKNSSITVDKILDDDTMAANDANALVTQQSLLAYIENTFDGVLGELEHSNPDTDASKLRAKFLTGTFVSDSYWCNIEHGISNAYTQTKILLVEPFIKISEIGNTVCAMRSYNTAGFPTYVVYDNTHVKIYRENNYGSYANVYAFIIYRLSDV
jgi:hypothetical protein